LIDIWKYPKQFDNYYIELIEKALYKFSLSCLNFFRASGSSGSYRSRLFDRLPRGNGLRRWPTRIPWTTH